jgi:hypothetical protein
MRGWRAGFIELVFLRVRAWGVWLLPLTGWHGACGVHVEWSGRPYHPSPSWFIFALGQRYHKIITFRKLVNLDANNETRDVCFK